MREMVDDAHGIASTVLDAQQRLLGREAYVFTKGVN